MKKKEKRKKIITSTIVVFLALMTLLAFTPLLIPPQIPSPDLGDENQAVIENFLTQESTTTTTTTADDGN